MQTMMITMHNVYGSEVKQLCTRDGSLSSLGEPSAKASYIGSTFLEASMDGGKCLNAAIAFSLGWNGMHAAILDGLVRMHHLHIKQKEMMSRP